jgi:endo-beta-N-acetylglucosaminidase D
MPENITGTTGFTAGAYRKPSSKDSGSEVFTVLEEFMTRIASHTHDGVDSEIINRTVSKTAYENTGTLSFETDSTTGQKTVDISISSAAHQINKGGSGTAANALAFTYWYYVDVIVANNGPGWVQFFPDVSWTASGTTRLSTSISETILDAAAVPKVKVQVY